MSVDLDALARRLFDLTPSEAQAASICVRCRRPFDPAQHTEIDQAEYRITALCRWCWAAIFPDES